MCVFPFQLLPVALRTFPVNDKGLFGKWSKLCLKLINSSLGFRFAINCTEIDLAKNCSHRALPGSRNNNAPIDSSFSRSIVVFALVSRNLHFYSVSLRVSPLSPAAYTIKISSELFFDFHS